MIIAYDGSSKAPGMNYLYGDSTTSTLKSNFLEFLRDAIDFCVFVLQADAKMKDGRVRIRSLGEEADAEIARLERFITSVTRAVDGGEKGKPDSPTATCATRLVTLIEGAQRTSIAAIRQELGEAVARIEAEESASRDACVHALGTLLAPHEPPDARSSRRVAHAEAASYEASASGKSEPALEWTLPVLVPEGHLLASSLRIERLVPQLEIRAPQLAGWITKEVKVKPQRIERHVVTELVDDGATLTIALRTEASSEIGFDFEVDPGRGFVALSRRVGPAEDQSVGTFELHADDTALVVDLAKKLREAVASLEAQSNVAATFEGNDFRELPTFVDFVQRLVAMMAPIVREISQRSLTHDELVLRRLLSNDRREEIFVAKTTLRDKLSVLPAESRALFEPLGLAAVEKAKPATAPSERPPIRSELPPSVPPPAMPKVTAKSSPQPAGKPAAAALFVTPAATPAAIATATTSPTTTATAAPISTRTGAGSLTKPTPNAFPVRKAAASAPQIEVVEETEAAQDALFFDGAESRGSERGPESRALSKNDGQPRNEALVTSLKKILKLSKNGRAGEAYQEYTNLFSSSAFAGYKPDDQRQALKLMVLAKSHPADKENVVGAHKAALVRIKALLETAAPEAADHELLGVTQHYLGDDKAARAAFQAGLDAERAKNPQSELVATFMRRVSQL